MFYFTLPETNIAHENPIFPGKYHQNCGFSMAMLVYRRVFPPKKNSTQNEKISGPNPKIHRSFNVSKFLRQTELGVVKKIGPQQKLTVQRSGDPEKKGLVTKRIQKEYIYLAKWNNISPWDWNIYLH